MATSKNIKFKIILICKPKQGYGHDNVMKKKIIHFIAVTIFMNLNAVTSPITVRVIIIIVRTSAISVDIRQLFQLGV